MLDVKTQASPARQKSKKKVKILIAIIAVVSVVLIVFGSIVLGPVLKNAVGAAGLSGPAEGGLADPLVKRDVWSSIVIYEKGNGCEDPESVLISIMQQPDSSGAWMEQWDVNACGKSSSYMVRFAQNPAGGGVVYSISR